MRGVARRRVASLTVCAGLLLAGEASASAFRVSPIQVALGVGRTSALLTVSNESQDTLRFQVSAFAWAQSPAGAIQLAPTSDIVFFPALVTLEPGKVAKVRIGSVVPVGAVEKAYRVFFEELRPLQRPNAPPARAEVRVLTKMGVPIFLEPVKESWGGKVEGVALAAGRLRFAVRNTGNVHFSLLTVHAVGRDATGAELFDRQVEGWYVLAGGVREYEIILTPTQCAALRSVGVDATTDRGPLHGLANVTSDCTPAKAK